MQLVTENIDEPNPTTGRHSAGRQYSSPNTTRGEHLNVTMALTGLNGRSLLAMFTLQPNRAASDKIPTVPKWQADLHFLRLAVWRLERRLRSSHSLPVISGRLSSSRLGRSVARACRLRMLRNTASSCGHVKNVFNSGTPFGLSR